MECLSLTLTFSPSPSLSTFPHYFFALLTIVVIVRADSTELSWWEGAHKPDVFILQSDKLPYFPFVPGEADDDERQWWNYEDNREITGGIIAAVHVSTTEATIAD